MTERPLFEPGRRAASADDGPDAAGVSRPEASYTLTLLGIVRGPHGGSAIVRADGQVRRLRPGEHVGPWKLEAVGESGARFRGDAGEVRELALRRAPGAPADPAPAPPAGAAEAAPGAPARAERGGEGAPEDPITHKSFEQRVAERRAYRESLQQRVGGEP